jgi:hypothetical protein
VQVQRSGSLSLTGMFARALKLKESIEARVPQRNVRQTLSLVTVVMLAAIISGIVLLADSSWAKTTPIVGSNAVASTSFTQSTLGGFSDTTITRHPTSLQFGSDKRLYVADAKGVIRAYTVQRNSSSSYTVKTTEKINLVKSIPNHDDNGRPNTSLTTRQVTGLVVAGTINNKPVIYVSSSDPRVGGGSTTSSNDTNLDTNSGVISRLSWDSSSSKWVKTDLVQGLPRSEGNHSTNGIALSTDGKTLYVAQGGNTNQGAPSNYFANLPQYAFSSAILKIDLSASQIACTPADTKCSNTYKLPTLDDKDPARGAPNANDPFGGNNGKNQAALDPSSPVQVYEPGFRNPYDILIGKSSAALGKIYATDNGGNAGDGGKPVGVNTPSCSNARQEGGDDNLDQLHLISPGSYGGHPNPTRGNYNNTFNSDNQHPVPSSMVNPAECNYDKPGTALTTFGASVNGLAEYTASKVSGAMQGNLLAARWDFRGTGGSAIYRIQLDSSGTQVSSTPTPLFDSALLAKVGVTSPLDVIAQGDTDPFPGTIWVADHDSGNIGVFEPTS